MGGEADDTGVRASRAEAESDRESGMVRMTRGAGTGEAQTSSMTPR